MRIARKISEIDNPPGVRVGFVPTMGAFHEGHLQLMRRARENTGHVVVSVFVNPTQFGKNEDFSRYPRNLERDAAMAESVGVDVVFAPEVDEMYPNEPTLIHVPQVTDLWEGASRPGHFDGVATVVLKLFNMVRPNVAYFGQKDLQQCLVVRRMVQDLNVPVELSFEPTVREEDGLAMSSRNVYLTEQERRVAPVLGQVLRAASKRLEATLPDSPDIDAILTESEASLKVAGFEPDYFAFVDLHSLRPCRDPRKPSAVAVAARLGRTRLIDNIVLHGDRLV